MLYTKVITSLYTFNYFESIVDKDLFYIFSKMIKYLGIILKKCVRVVEVNLKMQNKMKKSIHMVLRRQWHPTPVLLPGKSHGQRSLVGCSPWGRQELDTTEQLHFPFSLSCIGEGNGNPLQCSYLENPRDGGAW